MPQQTKVFRVFVSSTFTDMKEERHLLQKDVFPKLEEFCLQNNAKFQAVDLRWGVTEESQLNQKTLEICLNEVARCQRISPKPNFLILLGDKYGWQPIPEKIPEKEWAQILPIVEGDVHLVKNWYKKDANAVPPEYVLQPRGEEYKEYGKWEPIDNEIRNVLRDAVNKLSYTDEQRIRYFASATHQEILNGALNPPSEIEDPGKHVFALVRQADIKPKDRSADGFIDLTGDVHDTKAESHLNNLKDPLERNLKENYITYTANWKNNKTEIEDPTAYTDKIFEKLKAVIEEQLNNVIDDDEIAHEQRLHKEFKNKLVKHFRGRAETLTTIQNYLNDQSRNKTLSLIGESGSGKSSVMAKVVQDTLESESGNSVLVYRFLGTTSNSSNVISLMQSVSGQIAQGFDTELNALAGEGNEKALHEIYGMTEVFRKSLELATIEKPVVLFLDALDQLSDTDNAKHLNWLPAELPENVKIIVSSLSELIDRLTETQNEQLPLLPRTEVSLILNTWLDSINRTLTDEQYGTILSKEKSELPIYLKLAFEQAKNWTSYQENFQISDSVEGIITEFIKVLEDEHVGGLVEHVICYMLCGRYQGLAENEILDILVFDEEYWATFLENSHKDHREELRKARKIPLAVWSRLYLDLEPFLTERDADGVPIITFFHRQFNEVLRKKYKLLEEVEVE